MSREKRKNVCKQVSTTPSRELERRAHVAANGSAKKEARQQAAKKLWKFPRGPERMWSHRGPSSRTCNRRSSFRLPLASGTAKQTPMSPNRGVARKSNHCTRACTRRIVPTRYGDGLSRPPAAYSTGSQGREAEFGRQLMAAHRRGEAASKKGEG